MVNNTANPLYKIKDKIKEPKSIQVFVSLFGEGQKRASQSADSKAERTRGYKEENALNKK